MNNSNQIENGSFIIIRWSGIVGVGLVQLLEIRIQRNVSLIGSFRGEFVGDDANVVS